MNRENGGDGLRHIKTRARRIAGKSAALRWLYIQLGQGLHAARYCRDRLLRPPPILVYQMGKVGSRSVISCLSTAAIRRPIYHFHFMSESGIKMVREAHARRLKRGILEVEGGVFRSEALRRRLALGKERFDVVTLVRDPIGRVFSAFFHNAYRWLTDFDPERPSIDRDRLLQEFLRRGPRLLEQTLTWLESELEATTGVDVYSTAFDTGRGWQILEGSRARVLILRMENIKSAPEALRALLAIDGIGYEESNRAIDKGYGALYRDFARVTRVPAEWIEEAYSSRFARHFYSPAEIESFRRRWAAAGE